MSTTDDSPRTPDQIRSVIVDRLARLLDRDDPQAWERGLRDLADRIADTPHEVAAPALMPVSELVGTELAAIAHRYEHFEATGRRWAGHDTGLRWLDERIGGLVAQRVGILMAGPGTGKTILANQIAAHVTRQGAPALVVSLENPPADLIGKHLARIAHASAWDVASGRVPPADQRNLAYAAEEFTRVWGGDRLYIVDGDAAPSVAHVRAMVQTITERHPGRHPLVIVDYLQLLAQRAPGDDARSRVNATLADLRSIATTTGAHVLAISSMSRDGRNGDYSTSLAAAKESGEIEFAADYVLGLKRCTEPGQAGMTWLDLTLHKNRHGGGVGEGCQLERNDTTLLVREMES